MARQSERRRRHRARGAVLVEALLVAVALVLFLVAFLYVQQLFTRQLHVQKSSRAAALAFSMSACESTGPSGLSAEDEKLIGAPATAAGSSQTVADAQTRKIAEPAAANAFSKAAADNTGFGMPAVVSISDRASASATDGKETLSTSLHSRATLLCNERPREGTLEDSVSYILDFLD